MHHLIWENEIIAIKTKLKITQYLVKKKSGISWRQKTITIYNDTRWAFFIFLPHKVCSRNKLCMQTPPVSKRPLRYSM